MNDDAKQQNNDRSIKAPQNTPLSVEPLGSIEKQDHPPNKKQNQTAVYVEDWWERLPVRRKAAGIGLIAFVLIAVAPFSGKPIIEFLVTAATALFVGFIALNQYYISKKQWFSMREGTDKTQSLLEQNVEMVAAMKNQVDIAKDALKHADEVLEFNQSSFYRAERAYLSIRNVRPTIHKPLERGESAPALIPHEDPKFAFEIVNGGRTPAFGVSAEVYTTIGKNWPRFSEWTKASSPFSTDFVMPSEIAKFTSKGNERPDDDFDRVWSFKDLNYFVQIILSHWDIGDHERAFKFFYIFRYDVGTGAVLVLSDVDADLKPRERKREDET